MGNSNPENDSLLQPVEIGDCTPAGGALPTDSILIVDDEEEICVCLGRILRSTDRSVVTREDPIEALEFYKKHYMNIALVILDVVMPAMNGSDVFLAMKSINPAIKAVMISGLCSEDVVTKCLAGGALEFVRKPFTATEIIGVVDRHVLNSQTNIH